VDGREEFCNAFMGELPPLEKRQSECHGKGEAFSSQVVEWTGEWRFGRPSRGQVEIAMVMAD